MQRKQFGTFIIGLFALAVPFFLWAGCATTGADSVPKVLNGIDVLREQSFAPLAGMRVGLITNHTGLAADGTSTIDLLYRSDACELVALFSPEHGIRGASDSRVDSTEDSATGLPIFSLYGETRRPEPAMLRGIDALVFDIQDLGARFYTYITTMAYCIEAAAAAHIPFYVLDRPNPIGGVRVEGPMLDADRTSFIGYMPLPVRHGMTVGELARYFRSENGIGVDLHVVEMRGWDRNFYFWDTGQLWVHPSPNMRNMLEAVLYPGVCLLERTNVSVGRGTDRPFEMVGAPWIEPRQFARALAEAGIEGAAFVPVYFTPEASVYGGEKCGGVHILIDDIEKVHSVKLGLTLASVLRRLYPDHFELGKVVEILGNDRAMQILQSGGGPGEVLEETRAETERFLVRRRHALIYSSMQ
ncbi:MAG: DUF1343 domain-containing protein [Acidobacteriota bacterium]